MPYVYNTSKMAWNIEIIILKLHYNVSKIISNFKSL